MKVLRGDPGSSDNHRFLFGKILPFKCYVKVPLQDVQFVLGLVERNRRWIAECDFFHSGQAHAAMNQFADKRRFLRSSGVFVDARVVRIRHPRPHRHHIVRIESHSYVHQIPKTSHQEGRSNHQNQREREFDYHKCASRSRALSRTR